MRRATARALQTASLLADAKAAPTSCQSVNVFIDSLASVPSRAYATRKQSSPNNPFFQPNTGATPYSLFPDRSADAPSKDGSPSPAAAVDTAAQTVTNSSPFTSSLPLDPQPFTSTSAPPSISPSASSASATADSADFRLGILASALEFVPKYGWTVEALAKAAEKHGLPPVAHGLFPNGAADLVFYFIANCNRQLVQSAHAMPLQSMPMRERIHTLLRARLSLIQPVLSTWPQALGVLAQPQHAPRSVHSLAVLMDDIWALAGDKTTQFDWYTKRALLAGMYVSTELFMLTDASPGQRDTWAFLERRMSDLNSLAYYTSELGNAAAVVGRGAQAVLTDVALPAARSLAGSLQAYLTGVASSSSSSSFLSSSSPSPSSGMNTPGYTPGFTPLCATSQPPSTPAPDPAAALQQAADTARTLFQGLAQVGSALAPGVRAAVGSLRPQQTQQPHTSTTPHTPAPPAREPPAPVTPPSSTPV